MSLRKQTVFGSSYSPGSGVAGVVSRQPNFPNLMVELRAANIAAAISLARRGVWSDGKSAGITDIYECNRKCRVDRRGRLVHNTPSCLTPDENPDLASRWN